MGVERVKVQLWDCSGSMQYQPYWTVLAKVGSSPGCQQQAQQMPGRLCTATFH
jgi:hypothetical protein